MKRDYRSSRRLSALNLINNPCQCIYDPTGLEMKYYIKCNNRKREEEKGLNPS